MCSSYPLLSSHFFSNHKCAETQRLGIQTPSFCNLLRTKTDHGDANSSRSWPCFLYAAPPDKDKHLYASPHSSLLTCAALSSNLRTRTTSLAPWTPSPDTLDRNPNPCVLYSFSCILPPVSTTAWRPTHSATRPCGLLFSLPGTRPKNHTLVTYVSVVFLRTHQRRTPRRGPNQAILHPTRPLSTPKNNVNAPRNRPRGASLLGALFSAVRTGLVGVMLERAGRAW
jgi:hypothetical protein